MSGIGSYTLVPRILCFDFHCDRLTVRYYVLRVTWPKYSKKYLLLLEWPFLRTLSEARKARPTPKDAEFCQVHFLHLTFFFGLNACSLLIRSFLKRRQKDARLEESLIQQIHILRNEAKNY